MRDKFMKKRGLLAFALGAMAFSGLTACKDDDGKDPDPSTPNEQIVLEGLSGPVTVDFDADAVPHIRCETSNDCVMALGYLHARDRYIQMEVRRSFVRGRLHRLLPSVLDLVAPVDQANRLRFLTRDAQPIEVAALENASEETIAMFEAYSAGVNTWLDAALESGERVFSDEFYYALISRDNILEWTKEDSLATVVALVDSLTNSADAEIRNGRGMDLYGPDLFANLIFSRPVSDTITLFDDASPKSAPVASALPNVSGYADVLSRAGDVLGVRDRLFGEPVDRGSNNWAVGPTRSASGNSLLSDDPHLGHTNPATWYIVEMEAADDSLHVAGVTFAGLPWVILGQNEDIAWGATTTYFDQADVYLETLNDDCDAVIFNGEEVPMLPYDNTVAIRDKSSEKMEWVVPHHGPVLSIDCDNKTAVSFRWTGQDLSTDVNFLTELSRASTVEEARQALLQVTTLGQNWVIIDTQGNFGWYPYNRLPVRDTSVADYHPALPFPGDGTAEWIDTIPYDELPQLTNPADGYIATANNDMTGALYDGIATTERLRFQSSAADGLREERIKTLLSSTTDHTVETMLETVGDTYMALSEYIIPGLEEIIGEQDPAEVPSAAAVMDILSAWDGTCPTGLATSDPEGEASSDAAERDAARGCLVMHRMVRDLRVAIFGDEIAAAGGTDLATLAALTDLLTRNPRLDLTVNWWDDVSTADVEETASVIVDAAAEEALTWIESKLGADQENWLWGRLHRLTLTADLFPDFGITDYNNGSYAFPGGISTVNVAAPSQSPDDGFDGTHGASMRLTCEGLPEGMKCSIQLPGGQRHFRDSPYYANFLERWLTNTTTPLLFGQTIENPVEVVTFAAE